MNAWLCPACDASNHGMCAGATWIDDRAEVCACKSAGHE